MSDTELDLDRLLDLLPFEPDGMTGHGHLQDGGIWSAGDRDGRQFVAAGWMNRAIRHPGPAGRF